MRTPPPPSLLLATLLVVGTAIVSEAQPYWTRHIGSLGNDLINDVKVDADGYLYVTGEFSGSADFENETLSSVGGLDFFVAKLDDEGNVIWWKRGGGYGLDRGIKLALGPNNTLAVVGEFMGEATFQGVTLTSNDYTADMFTLRMDRTTGAQQWIKQGGGSMGADRPYGVTIAPNGQVTVAGEFQGTASWDGFTLTSIPDPETLIPTMDIVVVSYDATGTALWVQQGAADHTDRAIDVVNDPQGNLYVTGQFSDTITFDTEHLNAMYNATFLLKLDAAGNELWFRRCGGAVFDHVRDMLYTPGGELLLVGDLQGNMIFLDDEPDVISGEQDFNYYLLRVSTDGQLIASGQIGSGNGLSARGIDLREDTIAVVGQFNCQFTSMATFYGGPGLFMAAGSEDIFLNKHRFSDLGFVAARHYGGPGSKLAGQVAILPDGDPVMCGSFTNKIAFGAPYPLPWSSDDFQGASNYAAYPYISGMCPNADSIGYRAQDARGLKDGLLARSWVEDSVSYNWWIPADGACEGLPFWDMCIGSDWQPGDPCPDTLERCAEAHIYARLPFIPTLQYADGTIGPLVDLLWNNGDTSLVTEVQSTGWYSIQVNASNGCWSWHDSIYVIINPMPPDPLISDDVVVNTDDGTPAWITLCDPDSALIWCSNVDTSTTWFWVHTFNDFGEPDTLYNDTLMADTSGYCSFHMITDAGCERISDLYVFDLAPIPLDDYDLVASITFPQDTAGIDSVWLCQGIPLAAIYHLEWFLNGVPSNPPNELNIDHRLNGGPWSDFGSITGWYESVPNPVPGWNFFDVDLLVMNDPCGSDTLLFSFSDSIWVGIWPAIPVNIDISGPSTMCVGDSVLLTATCANCTVYNWSGPGMNAGDTTITAWASSDGYFTVHGHALDTNGCSYYDQANHVIIYPPGPLLLTDPANGIICPDDSAHIWTNTIGTDQIWYTPYGPVPNNSPDIWSSIAGEYYLTMIDQQGCFITSDPVLLTGYGTPYLNITPDNVLCLSDDEVTIQVVTTVPSSISWAAPFSGTSLTQVATQPGTYSVVATACGISTPLSVTVVGSDVEAVVQDPGPYFICPGDTVMLEAVPGAAIYTWLPGYIYSDELPVTQPGEYVLQAIDGNGCVDESTPVVVDWYDFPQPLSAQGDSICPGADATLTASGTGTITWFSDPLGLDTVFSGSPFVLSGLVADTVFYAQQSDGTCTGVILPAPVVLMQIGTEITFSGPAEACPGSSVTFTASTGNATQYAWTTPDGTAQGAVLTIDPVTLADGGVYSCTATAQGCGSVAGSFTFTVIPSVPLDLGPDVSLCNGDTAVFTLDPSYSNVVWNGAPGGYSYITWLEGSVIVQAVDSTGCPAADTVFVDQFQFGVPLQAPDVSICAGEDAVINAFGSDVIVWSTEPDMDPVTYTGNQMVLPQQQIGSTWYLMQTSGDCVGQVVSVEVVVNPVPVGVGIEAPSFVCAGDSLVITLTGPPDLTASWYTPGGTNWGLSIVITDFSPSDAGTYHAIPFLGDCSGDSLSTSVDFEAPFPFSLGPDTTYCNGGSITLAIPPSYTDPSWSTGATGYMLDVSSDGSYTAYAVDDNGCTVEDEVLVEGVDCPSIMPNFITPNGDGVNDAWSLDPAVGGFRTAELIVFDRLGNEVFHGDPSRSAFRGENDNREPLSEGVYFYVLHLSKIDGTTIPHEGYIHVIR